jgi:ABC-type polysaccharide/polyol phosphate export permease
MRQAAVPIYDTETIKRQSSFELKELLRYRFLITNLIARDLKVRYKRSVLGFIWVMLNPLLTMAVISIVFSQVIRFPAQHYYPTFLLAGILLWNLFAQGTVAAMSNLLGNGSVLKRIYVPPSAFVASSIGSALINLLFALGPFYILAIINGVPFSITWLLVVLPLIEVTIFSFGMGLLVSALMVFFTDTYEIYTVLINIYMYLSPVYYPISVLPQPLQQIEQFNPMYLFMDCFRRAILEGKVPHLHELGLGGVIACAVFLIGWLSFTRLERNFAYHF